MATPAQITQLRVHREVAKAAGRRVRPRSKPIPPLREPNAARMRYFIALRSIVDDIREITREVLLPRLPGIFAQLPADLRLDAPSDDAFRGVMEEVRERVEGELAGPSPSTLTKRIAEEVAAFNRGEFGKQMKVAIGIDPFVADPNLADQVDTFVAQNVSLIKSIGSEHLGRVEGIVLRGLQTGERHEDVSKEILKSFDVPKKRAELIAVDQVNKLNGQLTRSRQQQVGIEKYRWSTSKDERVRDGHKALEGTIQRWDRPPIENPKTGARGHPREPIRCRCDPIPVVDELLEQLGITPPQRPPAPPAPKPKPKPPPPPSAAAQLAAAEAKHQQELADKSAKLIAAEDAKALAKAREQAAVKRAAQAEAAAAKAAEAKAKAEAYAAELAAQQKAKNVAAAASHKEAFQSLVDNGADPQTTLKALKAIAKGQPEVFGELYDDVVKSGKGLGAKFFTNLPKQVSGHSKKILTKLGMQFEPPKPKWDKPYPKPEPAPLHAFEFKVISGNGFDWHDIHSPDGKKLGFVKKVGDEWLVDPPDHLKQKGWDKLTWPEADKATAVSYALDVSKAIQAATGVPKVAKPAVPAPGRSLPKGEPWSKAWKGRRAVKVAKDPAKDLAKRWNPGRGGVGVAGDGDWIEDFAIQFQQEIVDGAPELVARFKVNQHRSRAFFEALKGRRGLRRRKSIRWRPLVGAENSKPDVLEKGELTSAVGSRVGADDVIDVRVGPAHVTASRSSSFVDSAIDRRHGDISAMHNAVELRVPFTGDPAKDYAAFADAMDELGIDVRKGPNAAQLKAWKQAKVLAAGDVTTMRALQDLPDRSPDTLDRTFSELARERPWLQEWVDDLELVEVSPGHVAPYSEKVAQAVKDAGVTHLTHNASRGVESLVDVMLMKDSQQSGLLSSRERFNRGIFTTGMSTATDFGTGGADSVFTRIQTGAPATVPASYGTNFEIDPSELGRLDVYAFNDDKFGKAGPAVLGQRLGVRGILETARRGFSTSNEAMFRHSVPVASIRRVTVGSVSERERAVRKLTEAGIDEVNGIPVEEWIVGGRR
ncbi:MAG: hypothetical protein GWN84_20890 [Gammaproteobacteria bacterium]|nr:hypothetical protein [Gammaproteobacteria bacterium]NIR85218.1 hypothetical protein [Gammaproteobacteria bacterium]NIU06268.1 hypothetical protein [Gammaproteobacteria bacterium]NIX87541.1 hypothetical protein [Gammaproteobacteria bacterium]